MLNSKYSILLLSLLMTNASYASDNTKPDTGLNSQKNPFVKVNPINPNNVNLPGNLPQQGNNTNMITTALPTAAPRGLFAMDEASNEQKTDWDNLKVVGFLNNYVILRLVDNSNNEPKTIFTDLDTKFFINKNQYSIKYNNKLFTIYNKNNQPVHRLTIGNGGAQLIPRNNTANGGGQGGSGSSMGSTGSYNLNVNSGNNQNGVSSGTGK